MRMEEHSGQSCGKRQNLRDRWRKGSQRGEDREAGGGDLDAKLGHFKKWVINRPNASESNTRAGKCSPGLVTNQSSREGSGWSIWKVETASVDCLLRTMRREGERQGGSWRYMKGHDKVVYFCLGFLLVFFSFFLFKVGKTWHVYMKRRRS